MRKGVVGAKEISTKKDGSELGNGGARGKRIRRRSRLFL